MKGRMIRAAGVCITTVAIAVAPAAATAGVSGSQSSHAPSTTIGPAAPRMTPELAVAAVRFKPAVRVNTTSAFCIVPPGAPCTAYFHMSRGKARVTFLFSDGRTVTRSTWCFRRACAKTATGLPNSARREALNVSIRGPRVTIFYVT